MKPGIHPQYFDDCKITCACGNSFTTGATVPEIKIDVCSKCHPFFTGEMKFVDTLGRVEKFQAKQQKAKEIKPAKNNTPKKIIRNLFLPENQLFILEEFFKYTRLKSFNFLTRISQLS